MKCRLLSLILACLMLSSFFVACDVTPSETPKEGLAKGDYLYLGEYPQTAKAENVTLTDEVDERGYILGDDGAYYAMATAAPSNTSVKLSNGVTVFAGDVCYFKVEPIRWHVLRAKNGTAILLCDTIIGNMAFSANGRNNYAESDIRAWLNNTFYQVAFTSHEKESIVRTEVDNSAVTTADNRNNYTCPDTSDMVYLLCYADFINADYGLTETAQRKKLTTDLAKATGATNYWWMRSPYHYDYDNAWYVTTIGKLQYDQMSVTATRGGIVPVIQYKYE